MVLLPAGTVPFLKAMKRRGFDINNDIGNTFLKQKLRMKRDNVSKAMKAKSPYHFGTESSTDSKDTLFKQQPTANRETLLKHQVKKYEYQTRQKQQEQQKKTFKIGPKKKPNTKLVKNAKENIPLTIVLLLQDQDLRNIVKMKNIVDMMVVFRIY